MTIDFKQLKKRSKSSNELDKIKEQMKKMNSFESNDDDRYWRPTVDDAGNGGAIIRFIGCGKDDPEDSQPWVRLWRHAFQNEKTNRWYIENSLTTLGENDPVSEYNSALWKTNDEAKRKYVSQFSKRKLSYITNIVVLKDPKKPENEGKVFLFSFGAKIFDKIKNKLTPPDELSQSVNVFDLWNGMDFKLTVRRVDKFPNYDMSEWLNQGPLFGGDETKLEAVWNATHSITAEIAPSKFKTYAELKKRFDSVMGFDTGESKTFDTVAETVAPWEDATETKLRKAKPVVVSADDEDDELAALRALTNDD